MTLRGFMRPSLPLVLLLAAGCELVVDFDRSRIVDGGSDASVDSGSDASVDSGSDASVDGGSDASVDGGSDASVDGGSDASVDGGSDAAMGDATVDAGADASVDASGDAGCSSPADCDDGDACTMDVCGGDGACMHTTVCAVSLPPPTLDDLSTVVSVPRVESPVDGFVIIHEDMAGAPGPILGLAPIPAGVSTDVEVELDRPVADAETLHAMLHFDAGVAGTYEPGVDLPATRMGAPVVVAAVATVPAGTPAAELTVSGDGSNYRFAGRPSTLSLPSGADPAVALLRGYRYRVVNLTPGPHPFELIADGASVGVPADDVVQLSQDAAGALEGDADIDWTDDGTISAFTVSASFEAGVDAYRCSIHTASMRGPITYADP